MAVLCPEVYLTCLLYVTGKCTSKLTDVAPYEPCDQYIKCDPFEEVTD